MGFDLSKRYMDGYIRFPRLAHLHLLIKLRRPILALRAWRRRLAPPPAPAAALPPCAVTDRFDATREHFHQHGWAYVEPVLEPAFHAELLAHWPPRIYLEPPTGMHKSYDTGFRWIRGKTSPSAEDLARFPAVGALLEYVRSCAFEERLSRYYGKPLHCHSFLLTTAYPGSTVVPHIDGIRKADGNPDMVNLAFFINGTGGPRSGGLAMMRDNEFHSIVFEPTTLRNTMLLYDSRAPYYHGFAPLARGKFRWAIFAQYWGEPSGAGGAREGSEAGAATVVA